MIEFKCIFCNENPCTCEVGDLKDRYTKMENDLKDKVSVLNSKTRGLSNKTDDLYKLNKDLTEELELRDLELINREELLVGLSKGLKESHALSKAMLEDLEHEVRRYSVVMSKNIDLNQELNEFKMSSLDLKYKGE